jgi:hypothetical protein
MIETDVSKAAGNGGTAVPSVKDHTTAICG